MDELKELERLLWKQLQAAHKKVEESAPDNLRADVDFCRTAWHRINNQLEERNDE